MPRRQIKSPSEKKPAGRPQSISYELIKYICDQLALGRTLISICEEPEMPNRSTVFDWLFTSEKIDCDPIYKEFSTQYARAREAQAETIMERGIASLDLPDTRDTHNLTRSCVILAEKLAPKRYGRQDKIEHSGGMNNSIKIEIVGEFPE